jgi:hypothetical protein
MHAPDNPWNIRPLISTGAAIAPAGVIPTSTDPMILHKNPILIIFNLPTLSARPPSTTINIPENKVAIETAMFINDVSIRRSLAMSTLMFNMVCANSQKANTPRMIPNNNLSFPLYGIVVILSFVTEYYNTSSVTFP